MTLLILLGCLLLLLLPNPLLRLEHFRLLALHEASEHATHPLLMPLLALLVVKPELHGTVDSLGYLLVCLVEQLVDGALCVALALLEQGARLLDRVRHWQDFGRHVEAWRDHVSEVHVSMPVFRSHDAVHVLVVLEDFAGALEHGERVGLLRVELADFALPGQDSVDDDFFLFVSERLAVVDHGEHVVLVDRVPREVDLAVVLNGGRDAGKGHRGGQNADQILRGQALIEDAELAVQDIGHGDVQVPMDRPFLEIFVHVLDHRPHIVDTFLKEEAVDETTCPVGVGARDGEVDPELLEHVYRLIDLIRLMCCKNVGVNGAESHPCDDVVVLTGQLLVLE